MINNQDDYNANNCDLAPCGLEGDLDSELAKFDALMHAEANLLIDEINALVLPDVDTMLNSFQDMLNTYPTTEVKTIDDLSVVLGLPKGNDVERLYRLGIAQVGDVSYLADTSNNVKNWRELRLSSSFATAKTLMAKPYNVFTITTIPKLIKLISPSEQPFTLTDVYTQLGYKVPQQYMLNTKENGKWTTYVYTEEFIALNTSIANSAKISGVPESAITLKLFYFNTPTQGEIISLRNLGVTETALAQLQGADLTSKLLAAIKEAKKYCKTSMSEFDIKKLKEALIVCNGANLTNTKLDASLYALYEKPQEDIRVLLEENIFIEGINMGATEDSLIAKIQEVQAVEAGTHSISNTMTSIVPDNSYVRKIQLQRAQSLSNTLVPGSDATPIALILTDVELSLTVAGTTADRQVSYKSYDSGGSLLIRTSHIGNTFSIDLKFKKILGTPPVKFSDKALATPLESGFNAAFKVIDAFNKQLKEIMKKIEKMTSVGFAFTGDGLFQNSFLKCAAGASINFQYNPFKNLLNSLIESYNEILKKATDILRRLIAKIICTMNCMRDLLGLSGTGLKLPFCSISLPVLDISDSLKQLMKYTTLLNGLALQNINATNALRFALFDLSDSFTKADGSCNCSPLGGILDSISNAISLPSVPVSGAGAIGIPSF